MTKEPGWYLLMVRRRARDIKDAELEEGTSPLEKLRQLLGDKEHHHHLAAKKLTLLNSSQSHQTLSTKRRHCDRS